MRKRYETNANMTQYMYSVFNLLFQTALKIIIAGENCLPVFARVDTHSGKL